MEKGNSKFFNAEGAGATLPLLTQVNQGMGDWGKFNGFTVVLGRVVEVS
jgi:hypothetical protein